MIEIFINASLPRFPQTVELDGQQYLFRFDWNTRTSSWTMDISQPDGTALISGTRLVGDWSPIQHRVSEDLPPGRLMLLDTTGDGDDPTRDSLGVNHKLFYFEESEL